ncbi:hypothetical protein Ga0466249_004761 [Sporomusaceae bacterium BoRhaA]|uniref:hypothetical protein n=1 Tax=Pelorhabdus rhamnosifermentans TaxID=2772457 RepID=UPI001C061D3F|nr:hypothetical protein [Pelorhabdus rhamnosifermentans]MBU2703616.1 hypothetical protein [Pelorhabdus rhamnosifermentans]
MHTVTIGKGLSSLPWQVFVPVMFGLSIGCIYFAVTIKGKSKALNIVCFCTAIMTFVMAIERLATNTGMLTQYLPFIDPIEFSFLGIALIVLFFFVKTP